MNKYILIAATALTFAACTNEEMNTVPDGKVALQVNATIQGAQTRASGTEWAEGDEIGISIMGNSVTTYTNVCYKWNGSSFTTSPNNAIYFETSETVTFHAYYPYKGSADYTGVSTAADNQTAANQPKIDFLYASGATASKDKPIVNFTDDHAFTHCMSQITLTFIEGDGMDLDGSWSYMLGGLKLQGTFSPQTGIATADDVTAAPLTVNLTEVQPTSGSYIAPSLILFPQEVTSIPIIVTVGGQDYTGTLSVKDGKFQSGNNYTWKITVSKSDMSIGNAEIKGWEEVEGTDVTATT